MHLLLAVMMVSFLWNMKNFYGNTGHRDTSRYTESLRFSVGQDFGGSNGRAAFATQCTLFLLAVFGSIPSIRVRAIIVFLLIAGGYSVIFSYSRGAWVGFAGGVAYLSLFRTRWLLVVGLVLLPFVGGMLPESVIQRATMTYDEEGDLDTSSMGRVEVWKDALATAATDPILGVGFDCFRYYRRGEELLDTHNMYIRALVETGVVGLTCLVAFFLSAFYAGHRLAKIATDPFYRALGGGFAAYMISVILTNFFGDRWTYVDLSGYTWILLGLVVQATLWTRTPPAVHQAPAIPAAAQPVGAAG
jgi:O-antigen ligase